MLKRCTLPLTGAGVVDLIIIDLAVFEIDENGGGLTLIEIAPGVTMDDIKARTQADFKTSPNLGDSSGKSRHQKGRNHVQARRHRGCHHRLRSGVKAIIALPVTPAEQIEFTHEAFEAGASLVHIHVRNPDELFSSHPKLFQQVQEGINKHCPDMIVQFDGRTRVAIRQMSQAGWRARLSHQRIHFGYVQVTRHLLVLRAFEYRTISILPFPSAVRCSMQSRVGWWPRIRTMTTR